ncbi:MAG: hypothetical protein FWC93_02645 [Defluviitaleaceae bacterium]|nr:hypothetical protein [Defluviitaleaceae bacterium]
MDYKDLRDEPISNGPAPEPAVLVAPVAKKSRTMVIVIIILAGFLALVAAVTIPGVIFLSRAVNQMQSSSVVTMDSHVMRIPQTEFRFAEIPAFDTFVMPAIPAIPSIPPMPASPFSRGGWREWGGEMQAWGESFAEEIEMGWATDLQVWAESFTEEIEAWAENFVNNGSTSFSDHFTMPAEAYDTIFITLGHSDVKILLHDGSPILIGDNGADISLNMDNRLRFMGDWGSTYHIQWDANSGIIEVRDANIGSVSLRNTGTLTVFLPQNWEFDAISIITDGTVYISDEVHNLGLVSHTSTSSRIISN